jgi:Uncharacterized conserved protein (DUF2249)
MIELHDEHPMLRSWSEGHVFHLDVRALLEQGGEPYVYIMDCVRQVAAGDELVVHALFEPRPLLAQVGRMGLAAHARRIAPEHWTLTISAAPPVC